jgi:Flp pilus assembly protein TadG
VTQLRPVHELNTRIGAFRRIEDASATVEYAVIFVPLVVLIFFTFEMAMAYHWALAAQKGVENGVRYAVTQPPIRKDLIDPEDGSVVTYRLAGTAVAGDLCYFGTNCSEIPTVSCTGGAAMAPECDANRFGQLLQIVSQQAYGVEPENLTVTYEESGLGRATETVIPIVTVSIASREFPFGLSLMGIDTRLPAVSATLVAENLGN